MVTTLKLTDAQLRLLSAASQRDDLLLTRPAGSTGGGIGKATQKLLRHGLIEETTVTRNDPSWREEGDEHVGLRLTTAGLGALGIVSEDQAPDVPTSQTPPDPRPAPAARKRTTPKPGSKQALVQDLLSRDEGATIQELTAATGWLAHTMRAALTRLRQAGIVLSREDRDGTSVYRIRSGE